MIAEDIFTTKHQFLEKYTMLIFKLLLYFLEKKERKKKQPYKNNFEFKFNNVNVWKYVYE